MQHFDNHAETWSNVRTVASATDAVNAAALKQNENKPVGYTASKEQTRDMLEATIYLTALRVRSYAGAIGNEVLAQKTRFSRSSLDALKTNDLCIVANTLADACEEYSGDLVEYLGDQSTVNRLRELAAETTTLYAKRDTVVDERMEATARLKQLFAELRRLLKALNDLVEAFIDDDVFVATYFNARRTHDLKGRHAAQTKTEE
jgi:hypothetical protein